MFAQGLLLLSRSTGPPKDFWRACTRPCAQEAGAAGMNAALVVLAVAILLAALLNGPRLPWRWR